MKKYILPIIALIIIALPLFAINKVNQCRPAEDPLKKGLHDMGYKTYKDGNLKFSFSKTMNRTQREELMATTRKYIDESIAFLHETPLKDSIHFVLVPDRKEMEKIFPMNPGEIAPSGADFTKDNKFNPKDANITENIVFAVYGGKYSALRARVMNMVSSLKWGEDFPPFSFWLYTGLATYFAPEIQDCDGQTFEERYVYFLQNDKLQAPEADGEIRAKKWKNEMDKIIQWKTFENQSAYLVGRLIDNYGIDKLKQLWQKGMLRFEEVYGLSLDNYILQVNKELNEKYPKSISFNLEGFSEYCVK